jgi:hypothetical protein
MCMAANAHLQIIVYRSQNCVLWNSNFQITTCIVLLSQYPPLVSPSQSSCHGIGGLAHPDQMEVQGRIDEARPTAY